MPFDSISPYGYMAIWTKYGNMAISQYGYMALKMVNMVVAGKSNKNAAI
jgi:hypothetical protein